MIRALELTERQLAHLRAAVEHPSGVVLRRSGPWHRAIFTALANRGMVRMERRAAMRRVGELLCVVEEVLVFSTPRGVAEVRRIDGASPQ